MSHLSTRQAPASINMSVPTGELNSSAIPLGIGHGTDPAAPSLCNGSLRAGEMLEVGAVGLRWQVERRKVGEMC